MWGRTENRLGALVWHVQNTEELSREKRQAQSLEMTEPLYFSCTCCLRPRTIFHRETKETWPQKSMLALGIDPGSHQIGVFLNVQLSRAKFPFYTAKLLAKTQMLTWKCNLSSIPDALSSESHWWGWCCRIWFIYLRKFSSWYHTSDLDRCTHPIL